MILERPLAPVLRLRKIECPDDFGRMQSIDALTLDFDYDGDPPSARRRAPVRPRDRAGDAGGPGFVRRDRGAEAAALEALRQDGFVQMRIAEGRSARGPHGLRLSRPRCGRALAGFRRRARAGAAGAGLAQPDRPRFRPASGANRSAITTCGSSDAEAGSFSLDFGIEIDGAAHPLLPILIRLARAWRHGRGQIVDGELITSLEDGRILKLPAERIRRLLAVMADLIEAAGRTGDGRLMLPEGEAASVLDLEDLLTTRWENAARSTPMPSASAASRKSRRSRSPPSFTATLRPYQQQGVDWLQHLRAHRLSGFLADDMGLGKTAQTIAHIVIEQTAGRLDRPALIVVPTSLVTNWTAELAKFAPHLRVAVLHGLDRHERRTELGGIHVVITTYTVLARDIEEMTRAALAHGGAGRGAGRSRARTPRRPAPCASSRRATGSACRARRSRTTWRSFGRSSPS